MTRVDEEQGKRNRIAVLRYIQSNPKCSRKSLEEDLGFSKGQLKHYLDDLSFFGCVESVGGGSNWKWVYVKDPGKHQLCDRKNASDYGKKPAPVDRPTSDIPQSAPIVVKYHKGVKVTYQGAPKGLYWTDIAPGTGVISQDNPQLARLAHG